MRSPSAAGTTALVTCSAIAATSILLAQQPSFRTGANMVRVDAYVTADGSPVTNLTIDDFEVLEDEVPHRIRSFELVPRSRSAARRTAADPITAEEMRTEARAPEARLFVLLLDTPHVDRSAAQRGSEPVQRLLRDVITPDDLVAVMTPAQAVQALTFSHRSNAIDALLREYWEWSEARQTFSSDPVEDEILFCFGERSPTAQEKLARYRVGRTLAALDDLITYLEELREERKFVVILSEGWYLLSGGTTSPEQPTAGPATRQPTNTPVGTTRVITRCSGAAVTLSSVDTARQFQRLLQRASRANVSFYPVDSRGLVDAPPPPPGHAWARGASPAEALQTLARETDGFAVVGTNNIFGGLQKLVQDTGDYYLIGYYSTNAKVDGRFRRLTVRVKRNGVVVRARPGYFAPTKEEMTTEAVERVVRTPPRVISSLRGIALRRGPSTGLAYVKSQDDHYRRTERLRLELSLPSPQPATARVLGPTGTPLNVPVVTSTRTDRTSGRSILLADLLLAPLAQGDYELEVTLGTGSRSEVVPYRFSLIP